MSREHRSLRALVAGALDEMTEFTGTQGCVEFARSQIDPDELQRLRDAITDIAFADTVKSVLRNRKLPGAPNVPGFPSIEVETGDVDEHGLPVLERKFASMRQLLLGEDWTSVDKVVGAQRQRVRSGMIIANATVKAARQCGYPGSLPFPEIDDGDEGEGAA